MKRRTRCPLTLWNKIHSYGKIRNIKTEEFFSALWPPLSPTVHQPNLSHQQEYLLNHSEHHWPSIKKTTLWKVTFFLGLVKDHITHMMTLRPGLCKLSLVICHLMYSLYKKTFINCALTYNRWNSSQSFLRYSSQVLFLKFGSNKILQFFLRLFLLQLKRMNSISLVTT